MEAKIEIGETADGGYKYTIRSGAFVHESLVEQDTPEEAQYYARIALAKIAGRLNEGHELQTRASAIN